jgi:chorismate mutase-like protein
MDDLDALGRFRDAIDEIDGRLLDLLNERARLAQEIGKIKERNGRPVYAPERAEKLMLRLIDHSKGPLDGHAIRAIYREIMSASLALEKDTVIASEGEPGGLAHLAAKEQFGSSVRYTFHPDPETLFDAVATGAADCGVIPFGEEGPDGGHLELLAGGRVFICSEIILGDQDTVTPTRYLVLGSALNTPSGHDQTAFLMHLTDHPGALAAALEPFRASGVNIFSIHNRRSPNGGLFLLLEVEGHATEKSVRRCFEALNSSGVDSKLCGSYPRLH